jgi:hypothetical protein
MRRFNKGMINLQCKVSFKEGHMIVFTKSMDSALLNEIISDPGGSGSGSTTLYVEQSGTFATVDQCDLTYL